MTLLLFTGRYLMTVVYREVTHNLIVVCTEK